MILVLGGTTEGRKAVQVIDQAGKPFYYSTKGELQQVPSLHAVRLKGAMDVAVMKDFCRKEGIRLLVDAAHPFAEGLRQTVLGVSQEMNIPVIRYERIYPRRADYIIWCNSYEEAAARLKAQNINKLLALTGVQTIGKLKPFWQETETWFRILNRQESLSIAQEQGFPQERILFYDAGTDDKAVMQKLSPGAVLLKESGESGGFPEKAEAARQCGIPVFAVNRPEPPGSFYPVNGEFGLRRAIEHFLPGFYRQRTGITTGTCATAAATAALKALITRRAEASVYVMLPNGESTPVPVKQASAGEEEATAIVMKDAGDDADITDGIAVHATVKFLPEAAAKGLSAGERFMIRAGEGIGTVTLPGLGLEVGAPAINPSPQKMIKENLQRVCEEADIPGGRAIEVILSVPGGEEIAVRTFNPRLGITGGISIIGNSGIVKPYSTEAFVASIRKSMEVAKATYPGRLVLNSGAKSERYLHARYPDLPATAFVQYGNHIGDSLKMASALGFTQVTIGLMIGKAVKLAEGNLNTHSGTSAVNKGFLKEIARKAGCSSEVTGAIEGMALARELWTVIPQGKQAPFFESITRLCHLHCSPLLPEGELEVYLIKEI